MLELGFLLEKSRKQWNIIFYVSKHLLQQHAYDHMSLQTTLFQASKKTAHQKQETGFPWKFIRNLKSEFASAEISTRLIVQIIIYIVYIVKYKKLS